MEILHSYQQSRQRSFTDFNLDALHKVLSVVVAQQTEDSQEKKIISWFRTNMGLGESLSEDIVDVRKKFSLNTTNHTIPAPEDLFLAIDLLKTSSAQRPCMEFYNLSFIVRNKVESFSQAAVAFSLV